MLPIRSGRCRVVSEHKIIDLEPGLSCPSEVVKVLGLPLPSDTTDLGTIVDCVLKELEREHVIRSQKRSIQFLQERRAEDGNDCKLIG